MPIICHQFWVGLWWLRWPWFSWNSRLSLICYKWDRNLPVLRPCDSLHANTHKGICGQKRGSHNSNVNLGVMINLIYDPGANFLTFALHTNTHKGICVQKRGGSHSSNVNLGSLWSTWFMILEQIFLHLLVSFFFCFYLLHWCNPTTQLCQNKKHIHMVGVCCKWISYVSVKLEGTKKTKDKTN